jgi:hypothetical protein
MDRRRKKSSLFSSTFMSSDKGAGCPSIELMFDQIESNLTSCLVFLKKKKVSLALRAEPAALDVDTFTNPL